MGDGPYREEMSQVCAGLNVDFPGELGSDELVRAYGQSDLFVFPSGLDRENQTKSLPQPLPNLSCVPGCTRHPPGLFHNNVKKVQAEVKKNNNLVYRERRGMSKT